MSPRHLAARARHRLLPLLLTRVLTRSGAGDDLVRLGTEYGGWWVPRSLLVPGAIAYCGGLGEDASFDLELAARGLLVWAFDPTPKAIAYAAGLEREPNFSFVPVGWAEQPGVIRFYAPADPDHASYSAVNLQGSSSWVDAPVDTVPACAERLQHTRVDILKMDIEGLAHTVVRSCLESPLEVGCFCVEFDQPSSTAELLRTVRRLSRRGYRVAKVEGWNYTFVQA